MNRRSRSQEPTRDCPRTSLSKRSSSLVTHSNDKIHTLEDAKIKILAECPRGVRYLRQIYTNSPKNFRLSPNDVAIGPLYSKVFRVQPRLIKQRSQYTLLDLPIRSAILSGQLLPSARKPVKFNADDIRQFVQDSAVAPRFPVWCAGMVTVDDCQDLLRDFGLCHVARLTIEHSSVETCETITCDSISLPTPMRLKKKKKYVPETRDNGTQTSLGLYRRVDGQFVVTRPRSLRERKTSTKQAARQRERLLMYMAERDIKKKLAEVVKVELPYGERNTFCSLPFMFGVSKSKEREVIFSIQVNDDGEWVEKLVDTPEALASLKRLHNMERVATTRPTEAVVCPMCLDELVWLGECVWMTRTCLHLCHRECLKGYRKVTPTYKRIYCPYCRHESHLMGTGGDKCEANYARSPITLEQLNHPDYEQEEDMWDPSGNNLDDLTQEERDWLESENAIY